MTANNIYRIIKDIIKRAGIEKNVGPHGLRHTFASIAIHNKIKPVTLAKILGHQTANITYQVYAHELSQEEKAEEMSKLDNIF